MLAPLPSHNGLPPGESHHARTSVGVVVAALLIAVFVAVNRNVLLTPDPLNLLVTSVVAPAALAILGILAVVKLSGAVYMALGTTKNRRVPRRKLPCRLRSTTKDAASSSQGFFHSQRAASPLWGNPPKEGFTETGR